MDLYTIHDNVLHLYTMYIFKIVDINVLILLILSYLDKMFTPYIVRVDSEMYSTCMCILCRGQYPDF